MYDGKTVRCPICGRPYKVYSHYAGDQSACPICREEAEQLMRGNDFEPHYPNGGNGRRFIPWRQYTRNGW